MTLVLTSIERLLTHSSHWTDNKANLVYELGLGHGRNGEKQELGGSKISRFFFNCSENMDIHSKMDKASNVDVMKLLFLCVSFECA